MKQMILCLLLTLSSLPAYSGGRNSYPQDIEAQKTEGQKPRTCSKILLTILGFFFRNIGYYRPHDHNPA